MTEPPMSDIRTPSQTAGPFLSIGMGWCSDSSTATSEGDRLIHVAGGVFDGNRVPVTDAVLEFWQADAAGSFARDAAFGWRGFARALSDGEGGYSLRTVKPGRVRDGSGALQAPHIDVSIFARGLLQRVVTRIYFSDEPAANAEDPVLASITDPRRRATLVALLGEDGYRFDIRLQGEEETVAFVP
jgi:protocatechuate 3,4-dioxygenase alpha subunit